MDEACVRKAADHRATDRDDADVTADAYKPGFGRRAANEIARDVNCGHGAATDIDLAGPGIAPPAHGAADADAADAVAGDEAAGVAVAHQVTGDLDRADALSNNL